MSARFKELCMDTTGGDALGRFWAAASGCSFEPAGVGEPGDVVGEEEGMGIAMCPVPEAKTVKHRVHLDVHTDSVATLEQLGATRVAELPGWTVLADPEGGELCGFVRAPDQLPACRAFEIVVDSADPERIATWWASMFGIEAHHDPARPWWWLEEVPGLAAPYWVFAPVPEPKTVKNRIHWDVYGEVAAFESAGATRLWDRPRWSVLADPEGNEFCVFEPS
ncbi:MAG: hypothetical protein M3Z50_10165 [Actinomycetota bacterium]|nr:hypothetical protein [Actinomycetota bacterium]